MPKNILNIKNRGVNLELEKFHKTDEDWKFGALSQPSLYPVPIKDRIKYLPKGEVQRSEVDDMMDCATRAPLNVLETQFTYAYRNGLLKPENKAWLENHGYVKDGSIIFSDAFVAINSGTTREGNSLKAPLEAIRKKGLIPKSMLPLLPTMSFEEYHNKKRITPELLKLGASFADRFQINYEQVNNSHFEEANKDDMLVVAGYAWPDSKDGIYYRVEYDINHAWMNIKPAFVAFDNYEEGRGDFIKELSKDYKFYEYGYRVVVSREFVQADIDTQLGILAKALSYIAQLISALFEKNREVDLPKLEPIPEPPKPLTLREKVHNEARQWLGKEASPRDLAIDSLGCAESCSNILKIVIPEFPIVTGTWSFWEYLKKSKKFKATIDPLPGTIIISPTGLGKGSIPNGHVGIFTDKGVIMSNNSLDGLWSENFTLQKWVDKYRMLGGYPIYFFDPTDSA